MNKKTGIWLALGFGAAILFFILIIAVFIAVFFFRAELIELFDF